MCWVGLFSLWSTWPASLTLVRLATVVAWHRQGAQPNAKSLLSEVLSRDAVHESLGAEERRAAFERLAETLRDADRRGVPRPDQADHARLVELGDRVLERAPRAFGRIALAPRAARERPDALQARPAIGIEEPDAADERAARALLHRPHPVPAQLPVTEEHRHLPPRFQTRERLPSRAEVAHHLG